MGSMLDWPPSLLTSLHPAVAGSWQVSMTAPDGMHCRQGATRVGLAAHAALASSHATAQGTTALAGPLKPCSELRGALASGVARLHAPGRLVGLVVPDRARHVLVFLLVACPQVEAIWQVRWRRAVLVSCTTFKVQMRGWGVWTCTTGLVHGPARCSCPQACTASPLVAMSKLAGRWAAGSLNSNTKASTIDVKMTIRSRENAAIRREAGCNWRLSSMRTVLAHSFDTRPKCHF